MRFEVNGQMFFVNFVPEEGRWFCYAPADTGLQKIPVSIDASPFEAFTVALETIQVTGGTPNRPSLGAPNKSGAVMPNSPAQSATRGSRLCGTPSLFRRQTRSSPCSFTSGAWVVERKFFFNDPTSSTAK